MKYDARDDEDSRATDNFNNLALCSVTARPDLFESAVGAFITIKRKLVSG